MNQRSFLLGRRNEAKPEEVSERAVAELNALALLNNYRVIQEWVPHQSILPMLKANAYGHGIDWVANTLVRLNGLYGFGVSSILEGSELRNALGPRNRKTRVVVFSDSSPWTEEKGQVCEAYGLTPIIHSDADWSKFFKGGWAARIPYELHFNTGANRLGISLGFVRQIIKNLRTLASDQHPEGVLTHLAQPSDSRSKRSQAQLQQFRSLRSELSPVFPSAQFHFANSAAIWNARDFDLESLTDMVRPGLALYGVPPWAGAPERGIIPVLRLKARVIAVYRLRPGDSLGSNQTFKPQGNENKWVAVLPIGFGDGIKSSFSNQAHAWLNGKPTRFIGEVSVDFSAVECGAETKVGSWVEILGPRVDSWAQAKATGTVPEELLSSLTLRVKRGYERERIRTT